ncbi:hypothetical protein CN931_14410 [Bacillus sp. AFS054943]|uniref:Uncharacterized protein n=1 Tax=Bacillus cereus TaxID=1396 RepID=A0A2C1LLS4_BACCE|nr:MULTISPECIES: hypothetical protein [Bacillus]PGL82595.1 hypothetical protein CN931_14410 [Bacillus sp. AFS054943]PGT99426.1 hypothetical protein COD19_19075 [Bacillus cereus]
MNNERMVPQSKPQIHEYALLSKRCSEITGPYGHPCNGEFDCFVEPSGMLRTQCKNNRYHHSRHTVEEILAELQEAYRYNEEFRVRLDAAADGKPLKFNWYQDIIS